MFTIKPALAVAVLALVSFTVGENLEDDLRIYIGSWNIGEKCSSNSVSNSTDCPAMAAKILSVPNVVISPLGLDMLVLIGAKNITTKKPINMPEYGFTNYSQISAVCPGRFTHQKQSDVLSITVRPTFKILKSDSGCLNKPYEPPSAFAVALVQPPYPIKGCQNGICMLGINTPLKTISAGVDAIATVCGDTLSNCVVAAGDWHAPVNKKNYTDVTVADRMKQLVGNNAVTYAEPTMKTCCNTIGSDPNQGFDDHAVTNIPGVSRSMDIDGNYPLSSVYGNNAGDHKYFVIDMLFPCGLPQGQTCNKRP